MLAGKGLERIVVRAALLACVVLAGCQRAAAPLPQSSTAGSAPAPAAARSGAGGTLPRGAIGNDQPPPDMFAMLKDPDTTLLHPIDPKTLTASQRKFGVAPRRSSVVEYQPDVLIMEHGDEAIRSLGTDGMTWQFDADAPQVSEFKEGKIIFATGMAVGRIISLKRSGTTVTVVLGPIQLTDVIRKGKFGMDQSIDPDQLTAYSAPDFPQPKENTHPFGSATSDVADASSHYYVTGFYPTQAQVTPGIIQIPHPMGPLPIPSADSLGKLPLVNIDSDVTTKPIIELGKVGAQLYYYKKGGPNVFAEASMAITKLSARFVLDIEDGTIIECGIHVDGAVGLGIQLSARTYGKDFTVNVDREIWVPVDLKIPLGLNGVIPVPLSVTLNTAIDLKTGFSARNSSLSAQGDYTFGGGLFAGYKKKGGWQISKSDQASALNDIGVTTQGLSVGINSLLVSGSERVMVGIGAFGFNTGVYGGLRFGGTILDSPTTSWACRQGTIGAYFDSGVGYSLPPGITEAINLVLKFFTSYQLERVGNILTGPTETIFTGRTEVPGHCTEQNST